MSLAGRSRSPRRCTPLAAGAIVLAAIALAGAPARADGPRAREPSVQLFDEARDLYERGEYRGAIAKLEAALALDPDGKELVYNLALVHEKLGEIDDAERYYRQYLDMEADPKQRERVSAILRRLGGAKKEVAVAAPAPSVAPTASAAPVAAPAPEPARPGPSPWLYVAAGTAAGALAVGIGFGVSALATNPGDRATTGGGVTYRALEDDAATAHRHAVIADVSFGIATVVGAAALYLALSGSHRGGSGARAPRPVALGVGPTRASIEVRF